MDSDMPIMNGFEAAFKINGLVIENSFQRCSIIAYSALIDEFEQQKGIEHGIYHFLQKPASLKELENSIKQVLNEEVSIEISK